MRRSAAFNAGPAVILWLLLSSNLSWGQTTALALSSGTATTGGSVSLNLNLTVSAGTTAAGLQWSLSYPATAVASVSVITGPALTNAGKSLTCIAGNGSTMCLGAGLNAAGVASGVAAVVTVSLSSAASGSVAISVVNALAADNAGNSIPVSASGGVISVQTTSVVMLSSVSVAGGTIVGGSDVGVTVTLTGSAPGAVVTLTGSNSAFPSTSVTLSTSGNSQTFTLPTLPVLIATPLTITAFYNGGIVSSPQVTLMPATSSPGTATFVMTDTATGGKWKGVYGNEGFNVINDTINYPFYVTVNAVGANSYIWANSTTDARALQKASASENIAACWYTQASFTVELNFQDSTVHQVAFYLLDWDKYGRAQRVDILNSNNGLLDSRAVTNYAGGQYLVWFLSGHVLVRFTNLNAAANAVLGGIFFGGGSGGTSGATATFLRTDTTSGGRWKSAYGADGFNIIGDQAKYPAYAAVNASGNALYMWADSTGDTRALQKASAVENVAACWYTTGSLTIDINFNDSAIHQTALYLLDWDSNSRVEKIEILDGGKNVLDSRVVSGFAGGQYLVWNISGHVTIRISNANSNSNAVMSGIFFDGSAGAGPPVTFLKSDVTTAGRWKGVYGADGYNIVGDVANYPSYATVTRAGENFYIWSTSTTDPRALQKVWSPTDNVAACWYTPGIFTIDLNFKDSLTHQVALYVLDWDNLGRVEKVEILDVSTAVLDVRTASSFVGGQYLVWNIRGHVTIRITNANSNSNAVVSGLFFR